MSEKTEQQKTEQLTFKLKRKEVGELVTCIKPQLSEFANITDSAEWYTPLRTFEAENEATTSMLKAAELKASKDGGKDADGKWTQKGADILNAEYEKIMNQEVEFTLAKIDKAKMSVCPAKLSPAFYILLDKLIK